MRQMLWLSINHKHKHTHHFLAWASITAIFSRNRVKQREGGEKWREERREEHWRSIQEAGEASKEEKGEMNWKREEEERGAGEGGGGECRSEPQLSVVKVMKMSCEVTL